MEAVETRSLLGLADAEMAVLCQGSLQGPHTRLVEVQNDVTPMEGNLCLARWPVNLPLPQAKGKISDFSVSK